MSTRAHRPVKPKVVQVTPAAAAVTVEVPAIVPAEPAPTTPDVGTDTPVIVPSESLPPNKARVQTNKAIGVSISAARVRRHLDKLNLNAAIDTMISELKPDLTAYKMAKAQLETGKTTGSDPRELSADELATAQATVDRLSAMIPTLESKVGALSRERTRFSNEAAVSLSIICDELIQQLVIHTINRVLAAKKKIIQISHLHDTGVESLSLYPLIKSLPSFSATSARLAAVIHTEKSLAAMNSALAQAEREFKKKYAVKVPKKVASKEVTNSVTAASPVSPDTTTEEAAVVTVSAGPAIPSDEPVEESDDETVDSKTSFKFYISNVCKEVIATDARFARVRISTDIKGYLSDILIEFIQRLAPLVFLTANSMKNKTINDVAILRTVEAMLIDGHQPVEKVEIQDALIADPVILKAESTKRDEEKKAGRSYKIDLASVPKISGHVAVRTVSYPTSGYADLAAKVQHKLALYDALPQKEKILVEA